MPAQLFQAITFWPTYRTQVSELEAARRALESERASLAKRLSDEVEERGLLEERLTAQARAAAQHVAPP